VTRRSRGLLSSESSRSPIEKTDGRAAARKVTAAEDAPEAEGWVDCGLKGVLARGASPRSGRTG
jgi:hypothetical protein